MKKLVVALAALSLNVTPAFASFTDVPASHPYKASIEYVQSQGIVSGYPDGNYKPETKLDRAAFAKIVLSARFSKTDIDACAVANGFYSKRIFTDVEPGVWFERYFCLGKLKKVMSGYADGSVKPTSTIIFAEAAKILALSYGLPVRVAGADEAWFTPFVEKLTEFDAIPDSIKAVTDKTDQGTKEITRAEMADMIYRLRSLNDRVATDDGSLSLRIPRDALPEGIQLNTLKLKRIPAHENPVQEVNGAPMVFYEFEPEGLVFKKPVSFIISTSTLANTIPMVFLVSGENFDVLQNPTIDIDQAKQIATLTGEINHFSSLGIAAIPFPLAVLSPLTGTHDLNEPFPISAQMSPPTGSSTFRYGSKEITFSPPDIENSIIELDGHRFPANMSGSALTAEVTCSAEADVTPISVVVGAILHYEVKTPARVPNSLRITIRSTTEQPGLCENMALVCPEGLNTFTSMDNPLITADNMLCCPFGAYLDMGGPNCPMPHCHFYGIPHEGCGWGSADIAE